MGEEQRGVAALRDEDEVKRLRRQLRVMEKTKDTLLGVDVQQHGGRSGKILELLRREESELRLDIAVAKSSYNKDRDLRLLRELVAKNGELQTLVEEKRRHMKELDQQILMVKKNLQSFRLQQAQSLTLKGDKEIGDKERLDKLERRLDTEVKRLCAIIAENRRLREQIKADINERKQFNATWDSLVGRLNMGKKMTCDIMEQAVMALDQREEWVEKLNVLKYKATVVERQNTQELRDLRRQLGLQTEIGRFIERKCQRRVLKQLELKQAEKLERQRREEERLYERHCCILKEIQEFVGEDDMSRIEAHFVKTDEENFALFTYVNELNTELEALSKALYGMQKKIEQYEEINTERSNKQRQTIESLETELELCTEETKRSEADLAATDATLSTAIAGIAKIFERLQCDGAPLLGLLCSQKITENNVFLHLSILETRLVDMIQAYCHATVTLLPAAHFVHNAGDVTRKQPESPCPICLMSIAQFKDGVYTTDGIRERIDEFQDAAKLNGLLHDRYRCVSAGSGKKAKEDPMKCMRVINDFTFYSCLYLPHAMLRNAIQSKLYSPETQVSGKHNSNHLQKSEVMPNKREVLR